MSAKKNENSGTVNEELQKKGIEGQLEKFQKPLMYVAGGILVLVAGFFGYNRFVKQPAEEKATKALYMAETWFDDEFEKDSTEKDSFNLALNGDGINPGFLGVTQKHSGTDAANLAHFYAGVCYLHRGNLFDSAASTEQFQKAVDHLKDFSTESTVFSALGYGRLGDAYAELGQYDQAVKQYEKAVKAAAENTLTAPEFLEKLGLASMETGNFQKAAESFSRIKKDFPDAQNADKIERYIAMAQAKSSK